MSEPQPPTMTCEQILHGLNDYVDGDTLSAVCREFADHLAGCNPCQIVVDNIRNTIHLYKAGEPYPVPPEMSVRLRDALRLKWAERSNLTAGLVLTQPKEENDEPPEYCMPGRPPGCQ